MFVVCCCPFSSARQPFDYRTVRFRSDLEVLDTTTPVVSSSLYLSNNKKSSFSFEYNSTFFQIIPEMIWKDLRCLHRSLNFDVRAHQCVCAFNMQRRNFILKLAQIFAILWPLFTTGRFFMRLSAYQFAYDYSPRPHRVELHRLILKQLEKLKRERDWHERRKI